MNNIISFSQKRIRYLILFTLCALVVIYILKENATYYSFLNSSEDSIGGGSLLTFFYNLYFGYDFGIFILIVLLVFPLILGMDYFDAVDKKYDDFSIVRIGYYNYYKNVVFESIKKIWYFPLVINFTFIFVVILLGYQWSGDSPVLIYGYSQTIDFILFSLLQIVGWCILNMLTVILSQIIGNKYVYGSFVIIYTFAITMISLLIGFIMNSVYVPFLGEITAVLTLVTSPLSLISSRVTHIASGYSNLLLNVLTCQLLYLFLILILNKLVVVMRKKKHYVYNH
ncbi:MAG: hypothetical protein GX778_01895 [Erysipelothrix sp.]|nr:hypothetical protein [Erysipelothrix sp.]